MKKKGKSSRKEASSQNKEAVSERQYHNLRILALLKEYLEENPDIRFGQALRNFGIVQEIRGVDGLPVAWTNDFSTESSEIWRRIETHIQKTAEIVLEEMSKKQK